MAGIVLDALPPDTRVRERGRAPDAAEVVAEAALSLVRDVDVGELAMRTLAVALENLDDNRARQLVLSYCNTAARLRARRSDESKEQLP